MYINISDDFSHKNMPGKLRPSLCKRIKVSQYEIDILSPWIGKPFKRGGLIDLMKIEK